MRQQLDGADARTLAETRRDYPAGRALTRVSRSGSDDSGGHGPRRGRTAAPRQDLLDRLSEPAGALHDPIGRERRVAEPDVIVPAAVRAERGAGPHADAMLERDGKERLDGERSG